MRRAARTDANQQEIMEYLALKGCSVRSLASVGKGIPDLLVGYKGVNLLLEVKDGNKTASQQKLTPDQVEFFNNWNGQVMVVTNKNEAWVKICKTILNTSTDHYQVNIR